MVWLTYIGKRLCRSSGAALIMLGVPLALVVALSWLAGAAARQENQLDAPYNLPILSELTDSHGETGYLPNTGIRLLTAPELPLAPYVENLQLRRTFSYQWKTQNKTVSGDIAGISAWAAADIFPLDDFSSIETMPPYGEADLWGAESIFWAHQSWIFEHGLSQGDEITLRIAESGGAAEKSFRLVGSHLASADTLLFPWGGVDLLAAELDSRSYYSEIIRFHLADNRKIVEFKEAAAEYFAEIDLFAPVSSRLALTVHDQPFRAALISARQTHRMLEILVVLFFLLALGIGFLLGSILARSRRREFFLLRVLGVRPAAVLGLTLTEPLLFTAVGTAIGAWLSSIVWKESLAFGMLLLLCGCIMAGTLLSMLVLLRTGLMKPKEE